MAGGVQPSAPNSALQVAAQGVERPGGLALTTELISALNADAAAQILELGCGRGATLAMLRQTGLTRAVGVDISLAQLRQADPPLICAAGQRLPFCSAALDAVVAECSLSATGAITAVLAEVQRVLRPGGLLVFSDVYVRNPNGAAGLRALPLTGGLRSALTQVELSQVLAQHGFEIRRWDDRSEVLKTLNAQVSETFGSPIRFWAECEPQVDSLDLLIGLHQAKIGYCLVTAIKVGYE